MLPVTRPKLVLDFDLRHPAYSARLGRAPTPQRSTSSSGPTGSASSAVGFGEHHQSEDGYLPCPVVFAAAAGSRTKRIRLRISILLAALHDPLRLAEEVAVADLCARGRIDLALGVGYVEADFEAFGKDFHRRGKAVDELIPFLRRAWTGEPFEHNGTSVRATPRPFQDPMPDLRRRRRVPALAGTGSDGGGRVLPARDAQAMGELPKGVRRARQGRSRRVGPPGSDLPVDHDRRQRGGVAAAHPAHPQPDRLLRSVDDQGSWPTDRPVHPDRGHRIDPPGRRLPGRHPGRSDRIGKHARPPRRTAPQSAAVGDRSGGRLADARNVRTRRAAAHRYTRA